jgi:2-polyprenyl-6-methoxyphenol hydroxylase-like FAD-dependent oxidoreductase
LSSLVSSAAGPGSPVSELRAEVCVVGAGPAGLLLALELAKRGRRVAVVEQSARFERSFRGEAISPDSVWLLERLGLFDRVRDSTLQTRRMEVCDGGELVLQTDFATYDLPCPYPTELPQPPLLAAIAQEGAALPGFSLIRRTSAVDLLRGRDGRVAGVRCNGPDGSVEIRATLTAAADGRYSRMRRLAGLPFRNLPLGRDFVWFKLPRPDSWDKHMYRVSLLGGRHCVFMPTVPDQIRSGFNVPKGELRQLRRSGIGALHRRVDELAPELSEAVREHVADWSATAVLDIFTTVVPRWSMPGLVLVGDAAHTLTPILGQGVNHALLDAVVLAPLLADALSRPGPALAVDRATATFQRSREASVALSRTIQLRQERAFAVSGRAGVAARKAAYRFIDRNERVKRRLMTGVFYALQTAELRGETRLELIPSPCPAQQDTVTAAVTANTVTADAMTAALTDPVAESAAPTGNR